MAWLLGLLFAWAQGANPVGLPADTASLRNLHQKVLQAPERLTFDIIWGGWSYSWVHAGQATLELLPTPDDKVWEIRSRAWCNGLFQSLYPVQDTVVSFVDAAGIYPLRFEKNLHEGSYHKHILTVFDQKQHFLATEDTTFSIAPFTQDVLSAFYFIRTQTLEVGKSFELSAVSGKKNYKLRVLCHDSETVTVPAGTFACFQVEPLLQEDGLFKAKGKLWIWITQDARHLPVKMQSHIPVGSIKAELTRIQDTVTN